MDEREQTMLRMMVGEAVRERWEESPPDVEEWVRALEGCSKLYASAVRHLQANPPNYEEAGRCISVAIRAGEGLVPQIALAYAMSGQAVEAMLGRIRESLDRE